MKRTISLVCMLFICMMTFAGNPVKNLTGKDNLKTMAKTEATAVVVIDWSAAKFDKTKSLESAFGEDLAFVKQDCIDNFVESFNNKSKKIKMSAQDANAKYKYVIKVTNIDSYYCVMGWVAQWEAKVWGSCQIIDNQSKQVLVSFDINEAEDGKDMVKKECYGETFGELAETIAKLK